MGAAEAAESQRCSPGRDDCDAAVVGGGRGVWILCPKDAVWNCLRRTGGGDWMADLDGAVHGDYFPGRGMECGAGGEPATRAGNWVRELCAWSATPGIRVTSRSEGHTSELQ